MNFIFHQWRHWFILLLYLYTFFVRYVRFIWFWLRFTNSMIVSKNCYVFFSSSYLLMMGLCSIINIFSCLSMVSDAPPSPSPRYIIFFLFLWSWIIDESWIRICGISICYTFSVNCFWLWILLFHKFSKLEWKFINDY